MGALFKTLGNNLFKNVLIFNVCEQKQILGNLTSLDVIYVAECSSV